MLAGMRDMSVTEQRYQAVLDVIGQGRAVMEVASQWGVSRRTVERWLARYEAQGLEGLPDRSHRPERCPHQMPAEMEVMVLELRRAHRYWGARRLVLELVRKGIMPTPSESAVYRCLVRAGVIDPVKRHRRREMWKRWERGGPMELWQLDVVGGFLLANGTSAKALTGVDDHSRFCVSARLMPREGTQLVCDGLLSALRTHGVPQQVLTDNGKVFTGKYSKPPVDVLFDRICRENGIDHLLTQPACPTTTGKIERFHRTLRLEFDTRRAFATREQLAQNNFRIGDVRPGGVAVSARSSGVSTGALRTSSRRHRSGTAGAAVRDRLRNRQGDPAATAGHGPHRAVRARFLDPHHRPARPDRGGFPARPRADGPDRGA